MLKNQTQILMKSLSFFPELAGHFLGGMSPAYLLATMLFISIGAALHIGIDVMERSEESSNTPHDFSWKYFWRHNRMRIALNVIAAYCTVRFFSDMFSGQQISMFWAFAVGLVFDWILVAYRELMYLIKNKLDKALKKFI